MVTRGGLSMLECTWPRRERNLIIDDIGISVLGVGVPHFVLSRTHASYLPTLIYLSTRLMAVTRGLMQFSAKRSRKVEALSLSLSLGYAIDQTFCRFNVNEICSSDDKWNFKYPDILCLLRYLLNNLNTALYF